MNNRVAIYIDGSNFYHKIKELGLSNLVKFDYRSLSKWLAGGREIISCRYYIGIIRAEEGNEKGQELRKNQQRLLSHLHSSNQNFVVKNGYMMKSGGVYHEKGVDVKLAVDLLVGAYDDLYDTAILVSSDTDLIPAISKIRHLDKEMEYIGFSHNPSLGMQKYVNRSRLLTVDDLKKFEFNSLF